MNLFKTQIFLGFLLSPFHLWPQVNDSIAAVLELDSFIYAIDKSIQKNDFDGAYRLCKHALQLANDTWGPQSEHVAKCLFQEGRLFKAWGRPESAEQAYFAASEILAAKYGESSEEYLSALNNLSGVYNQMGRFRDAERMLDLILQTCHSDISVKKSLCLKAECNLASVYRSLARYHDSEALIRTMLANPAIKSDTSNYLIALSILATNYSILGRIEASDSLYQVVLALHAAKSGRVSVAYANAVSNVVNLYDDQGNYNRAIDSAAAALAIYKNLRGENHPDYARMLSNEANIFAGMGNYTQAEAFQKKAIEIRASTLGKEHPDYATSLNNLGAIYTSIGRVPEAEALYMQALEIQRRNFGNNHPTIANTLGNLGTLYARLGIFDKAERHIQASLEVQGRLLGTSHVEYARTLNNLSNLYANMGNYEKAISSIQQSIHITEASLGSNHPSSIGKLITLVNLLRNTNIDSADLLSQSIHARMIQLGLEQRVDYLRLLQCMADIKFMRGNYEDAVNGYIEILKTAHTRYGSHYPDNAEYTLRIARCYLAQSQADAALPYLFASNSANRHRLKQAQLFMSEKELLDYMVRLTACFNTLAGVQFSADYIDFQLNRVLMDNLLLIKELSLQSNIRLRQAVQSDTSLRRLSDQYLQLQGQLTKLYQNPGAPLNQIMNLEQLADSIQKVQIRVVFSQNLDSNIPVNINLCEALNTAEAAVEFAHFNWKNKNGGDSDSVFYYALVQLSGLPIPHFIPLFEERQLAALLDKTAGETRQASTLYSVARSGELLDVAPAYGTALYNLVWRPLDSLLQTNKIKIVYFSPSGLLHRLAFAALPASGNKTVSDIYSLRQLGSTRSLVLKTPEPVDQKYNAVVFGGVDYDRNVPYPADSAFAEITDNRLWKLIEHPRTGAANGFDYLPGTYKEALRVEQLLQHHRVITTTYSGPRATEETLKIVGKNMVKSPDILHIATHGFFFPNPDGRRDGYLEEDNVFKWNENPLLRTGLVMAGANAAWTGQPIPYNLEDGIATAYEISHLNLSNTKLAVLSACETGLGDVRGSEGVYGLQRAFKMAGVEYLLVSLWQVPDKETAEFMDVFYKKWLKGKAIHDAFAIAQKKIRKKYRDPYSWAAWVLLK